VVTIAIIPVFFDDHHALMIPISVAITLGANPDRL
jgi:hypothetical protein